MTEQTELLEIEPPYDPRSALEVALTSARLADPVIEGDHGQFPSPLNQLGCHAGHQGRLSSTG